MIIQELMLHELIFNLFLLQCTFIQSVDITQILSSDEVRVIRAELRSTDESKSSAAQINERCRLTWGVAMAIRHSHFHDEGRERCAGNAKSISEHSRNQLALPLQPAALQRIPENKSKLLRLR